MKIRELSKKEIKEIFKKLESSYEIEIQDFLIKDFIWFVNKEGKVFILRKEAKPLLKMLSINKLGLYILRLEKDGIRFSIEGSQIFGPSAKKNIVEVNRYEVFTTAEIKKALKEDIKNYVILKDSRDYLGSGKVTMIGIKLYIPKNRKLPIRLSSNVQIEKSNKEPMNS